MSESKTGHHHILPLSLYLTIGSVLVALTAITVIVAQFHFGEFNLIVAMLIAGTKATLVALYFMHLRYDNKLYATVFLAAIAFLAIFIIFTLFDTLRRGEIDSITSGQINPNVGMSQQAVPNDTTGAMFDSTAVVSDSLLIDSTAGGH